jgi:hypothetical protein
VPTEYAARFLRVPDTAAPVGELDMLPNGQLA